MEFGLMDNYLYSLCAFGAVVLIVTFIYYSFLSSSMRKLRNQLQKSRDHQETIEARIHVINDWFNSKRSFLLKKLNHCWDRFYSEYKTYENHYIHDVFESFK